MIAKSNTKPIPRLFLDRDSLKKGKMKQIMKQSSQLSLYLRMKKKSNLKS